MTQTFPKTNRNRVKRLAERGHYDADVIYPIIDEALICHVSFMHDGQPFIIPTLHARDNDRILLHGSQANRMLRHLEAGGEVCIAFTLVDGLVIARSVFHHSINYRSAVVFGKGELIEGKEAQYQALEVFMDKFMPERWNDSRVPNEVEMVQTTIVSVPIESASAKVRVGPPKDDAEDFESPYWSGVLPFQASYGTPITDPTLKEGIEVPDYVRNYRLKRP
jgi:uncharacterized protein